MLKNYWRLIIMLVCTALVAFALAGSISTQAAPQPNLVTPLNFPDGFTENVKTVYGAAGNGVTDDTAAIQAALNNNRVDGGGNPLHGDYSGYPKALYFPAGTYLVSNKLSWVGCCMTLQGQGAGVSIIRLKDSATGFGNQATPKPVFVMQSGNMSFHQNFFDLTINTGSNNPGAVGIDYISSNIGGISGVSIVSGDGQGVRGLDMTRQWPGPLLIKNLQVSGFDYGIQTANAEYGPTLEGITLSGQKKAGIFNDNNTLAIRNITSTNTVPAIESKGGGGSIIVLNGTFSGGLAGSSAISSTGNLYARNVIASGYQSAIRYNGAVVAGLSQSEYVGGQPLSLFDSPLRSLNLPVEETPEYHDNNLANWGKFTASYYGDTSALQGLLNSGKSTIYFPQGVYFSYQKRVVTVPASVKRIVGFFSAINRGVDPVGIEFRVEANSSDPLIIENFKYGVGVVHASPRTVVIKHGGYDYTDTAQAGKLFLEDVGIGPFNLNFPHQVWARQLNVEGSYPKLNNKGATLWILGLKTEGKDTVITTTAGGRTELLGTLIYPATGFNSSDKLKAAFISRESRQSLIYSISNYLSNGNYDIQVEETRGGVTKKLLTSQIPGGTRMPLFAGFAHPTLNSLPAGGTNLNFAAKINRSASPALVSISNTASPAYATDLLLANPVLGGSGASVFSVTPTGNATIKPANVTSYSVNCLPVAVTTYSATLSFTTNDPLAPTLSYNLSCQGLPLLPAFGASLAPGATIKLFGAVNTTASDNFTVINAGDAGSTLTIGTPTLSGANAGSFNVSPNSGFNLASGAAGQTVTIGCTTPATASTLTASLSFTTTDPAQPNVSYNLACVGLNPSLVTNPQDDGTGNTSGSLSYALKNYSAGQIIQFALPDGGRTVEISAPLWEIPAGAYIDGGSCDNPSINLWPATPGTATIGLHLLNKGVTIRNLSVNGFSGQQIKADLGSNTRFVGCSRITKFFSTITKELP